MAQIAVELVLEPPAEPRRVVLPPEMVRRATVAPVAR